jgi:hypothetical protein
MSIFSEQIDARTTAPEIALPGAVAHFYDEVQQALDQASAAPAVLDQPVAQGGSFRPVAGLPPLDERMRAFLSSTRMRYVRLGAYGDTQLSLLDLRSHRTTRTTKTFASHVIVARAVHHIQRTGERIMIVTPSSANKATAMRDAVARAIDAGLVTAEQLRVAVLVPATAAHKLWRCELDADPRTRDRNPVAVWQGAGPPSVVKQVAEEAARAVAASAFSGCGIRLWYTLTLENYIAADAVRGFFEETCFPATTSRRVHVHAVSSAFGLLGHDYGRSLQDSDTPRSGYLLVQHLGTPDMVLSLCHGSPSRDHLPPYRRDDHTGLLVQDVDPHFPGITTDAAEQLEPTFYTHAPATSRLMNRRIHEQGGSGIVVSRHECLSRYDEVRELLSRAAIRLPSDPDDLREWSLVMAVVGALQAVDRELVDASELVIHGSGSYAAGDFRPVSRHGRHEIDDTGAMASLLLSAAAA